MTNTKREALLPSSALMCTVAALLLPKCPLCIAAYVSLLGVGAGVAGVVSQALRPLLVGVALLALVWAVRRRRMRQRRDPCCTASSLHHGAR